MLIGNYRERLQLCVLGNAFQSNTLKVLVDLESSMLRLPCFITFADCSIYLEWNDSLMISESFRIFDKLFREFIFYYFIWSQQSSILLKALSMLGQNMLKSHVGLLPPCLHETRKFQTNLKVGTIWAILNFFLLSLFLINSFPPFRIIKMREQKEKKENPKHETNIFKAAGGYFSPLFSLW